MSKLSGRIVGLVIFSFLFGVTLYFNWLSYQISENGEVIKAKISGLYRSSKGEYCGEIQYYFQENKYVDSYCFYSIPSTIKTFYQSIKKDAEFDVDTIFIKVWAKKPNEFQFYDRLEEAIP